MLACVVHDWGQVAKGVVVLASLAVAVGCLVIYWEQERARRRREARSRWLLASTPERRRRYEGSDDGRT